MTATTNLKRVRRAGLWPFWTADWYVEPARRRTILIQHHPRSIYFPEMAFCVTRFLGRFVNLHVFVREDGELWTLYSDHVHGSTHWMCLGTSHRKVELGLLDPIEAFWNTSFHFLDPTNLTNAPVGEMGRDVVSNDMRVNNLVTIIMGLLGTTVVSGVIYAARLFISYMWLS